MKILGIDPGTRRVGYGVIERTTAHGKNGMFVEADLLPIHAKTDAGAFKEIKAAMDALIARVKPDVVAVEKLFFSKNQKTAMEVAQARGVIILAIAEAGVVVREYTPNEVKLACTGDGRADKRAIAKMVRLSLRMPHLNVLDDVTDALAIAICALAREKFT